MSKEIQKKFEQVSKLFAEIAILLGSAAVAAPAAEAADPKAALTVLAGKKDPKLVEKILAKFGADNIEELDDKDLAKATEKIEALDDVEGGGSGDADEEITIEKLRELGQELITDGKADAMKKVLKKFSAESISKLDKKHYADAHAKLLALKE